MAKWSEKQAFEVISRKQLIELFKLSAQLMFTIDGLWFLGAEKIMGTGGLISIDQKGG